MNKEISKKKKDVCGGGVSCTKENVMCVVTTVSHMQYLHVYTYAQKNKY